MTARVGDEVVVVDGAVAWRNGERLYVPRGVVGRLAEPRPVEIAEFGPVSVALVDFDGHRAYVYPPSRVRKAGV